MQILGTPLDAVDFAFLEQLRANQVQESITHDYKAELPDPRDDDAKTKFARSISALANTQGGILVYGFDAPKQGAWSIRGLAGFRYDERVNSLDQTLASKVDPRLPRPSYVPLVRSDGDPVLLVGIARSLGAPHAVIRQHGLREFWRRGNVANHPMTVNEIRDAFLEADRWLEAANALHDARAQLAIGPHLGIISALPGAFVLHVLPLGRLQSLSVPPGSVDRYRHPALPYSREEWDRRPNLEGVARVERFTDEGARCAIQHFRHGGVEFHRELERFKRPRLGMMSGSSRIFFDAAALEIALVASIERAWTWLSAAGVQPPVSLHLSVRLPADASMDLVLSEYGLAGRPIQKTGEGFDRQGFSLPALTVDTFAPPPTAARPLLDMLWQTSGDDASPFFRSDGTWELQDAYARDVPTYQPPNAH